MKDIEIELLARIQQSEVIIKELRNDVNNLAEEIEKIKSFLVL